MVSEPFQYVRAEEHALPYRVLFEELLQTGKGSGSYNGLTFLQIVQAAFSPGAGTNPSAAAATGQAALTTLGEAEALLFRRISAVEDAYRLLASLKDQRRYSPSQETILHDLETPLLQVLHRVERTAICLSGGGIRSAALSLGVLQMLARYRNAEPGQHAEDLTITSALEEFDYLSTVSGGGYIGSWLTAWTHRVDKVACDAAAKVDAAKPPLKSAYHQVARSLAGDVFHTSGDPDQRPVRHLREYTSFLAPKLGFTLDSFTLAAIVLRNLFVNWLMILPILFTLASFLQLLRLVQFSRVGLLLAGSSMSLWWGLAAVLFVAAGIAAGMRMPSSLPVAPVSEAITQGEFRVTMLFVLPLFFASQVLIRLWFNLGVDWGAASQPLIERMTAVSFFGLLAIPAVRVLRQMRHGDRCRPAGTSFRPVPYIVSGLAAALGVSALLSVALYGVGKLAANWFALRSGSASSTAASSAAAVERMAWHLPQVASAHSLHITTDSRYTGWFAVLAFPAVWILIMLASSLFSALLGAFEEDVDREWWARAGGLMMSVLLLWTVGIALVMVAPHLADTTARVLGGISIAGLGAGLMGALGGSSTAGAVGATAGKQANVSAVGSFLTKYNLLLPLLCAAALLLAATVVAAAEYALVAKIDPTQPARMHLILFVAFAAASLSINAIININLFSLHGMYRMRLMRAFLGASNLQRLPNGFTGFDDTDNIDERDIRTADGVPLHVVNTTVNLVGTTNSAWRQRKAEGFTISPLHSGGWRLGYTRTAAYGGRKGLTLATAMAISGAAFNPNMGYHSSALVTLIMTLFNVRLGWWLPNPKYRSARVKAASPRLAPATEEDPGCELPAAGSMKESPPPRPPDLSADFLKRRSPGLALWPLLEEALGGTNDEGRYIELTDGAHFENLGLYEMVMRRVRWIVVVDGSADPDCQLEDLGNAIRKIQIDLGIPIIFRDGPPRMEAGLKTGNLYCAVAEIQYQVTDYGKGCGPGHLLYIKAGLNGQEPPDVLQYARTHPTFPHEATANQFFTESQFESYRHLGTHETSSLLWHLPPIDAKQDKPLVRTLFQAAARYMATPPPGRNQVTPPKKDVALAL